MYGALFLLHRLLFIVTVELQWLEQPWNHANTLETGVVELISVNQSARSGGIIRIYFRFSIRGRYIVCSY